MSGFQVHLIDLRLLLHRVIVLATDSLVHDGSVRVINVH